MTPLNLAPGQLIRGLILFLRQMGAIKIHRRLIMLTIIIISIAIVSLFVAFGVSNYNANKKFYAELEARNAMALKKNEAMAKDMKENREYYDFLAKKVFWKHDLVLESWGWNTSKGLHITANLCVIKNGNYKDIDEFTDVFVNGQLVGTFAGKLTPAQIICKVHKAC